MRDLSRESGRAGGMGCIPQVDGLDAQRREVLLESHLVGHHDREEERAGAQGQLREWTGHLPPQTRRQTHVVRTSAYHQAIADSLDWKGVKIEGMPETVPPPIEARADLLRSALASDPAGAP